MPKRSRKTKTQIKAKTNKRRKLSTENTKAIKQEKPIEKEKTITQENTGKEKLKKLKNGNGQQRTQETKQITLKKEETQEQNAEKLNTENQQLTDEGKKKMPAKKRQSPEARKKSKKIQDAQKKKKKLSRPIEAKAYAAKLLWGQFRPSKISKEKRLELIDKLLDEIKTMILQLINKRSTSHVIQSVLKLGSVEQRARVFDELKEDILAIAKHIYARHTLLKMILYGTKDQRAFIMKQFQGKVRKLFKHKEACTVLEYVYMKFTNAQQKKNLIEEFYSPEFALFKGGKKRTLEEIFKENPEKKGSILASMREYLLTVLNKPELLQYNIIHRPILEYLNLSSYKEQSEMIQNLREHVARMLHTSDGSKVGVLCVSLGTRKDRKVIVQSFRGYISKICKEEFGFQVFLSILTLVDDVVVVKTLLQEMLKDKLNLCCNEFGKFCFLVILVGLSPKYFKNHVIKACQPKLVPKGDDQNELVPTSKKDPENRRQEHLQSIISEVTDMCFQFTYELITDKNGRYILFEVILLSEDETKKKLIQNILNWVNIDPMEEDKDRKYHPMEKKPEPKTDLMQHEMASKILSHLVGEEKIFAEILLEKVIEKLCDYAIQKYSSWVISSFLENEKTKAKVGSVLREKIDDLEKSTEAGTQRVVKNLKQN